MKKVQPDSLLIEVGKWKENLGIGWLSMFFKQGTTNNFQKFKERVMYYQ